MRVTLSELPFGTREFVLGTIALALDESRAFRKRNTWSSAVVVWRQGKEAHVTSRADFASFLRANALHAQAREVMARRIRRGEVLVWLELDLPSYATARLDVVDVVAELRALRGSDKQPRQGAQPKEAI